jgi:hypothetical protein
MLGLVLAGAMLLGQASTAEAQIAIRNPWTGGGVYVGAQPWGYGYGSSYYAPYSGYNSFNYGWPGTSYYSSAYVAPAAASYYAPGWGYSGYGYAAPYYGTTTYYSYGYPSYFYGRRGFIGRRWRVW